MLPMLLILVPCSYSQSKHAVANSNHYNWFVRSVNKQILRDVLLSNSQMPLLEPAAFL